MYWPPMNEDVKTFISRCEVCKVYQDRQQKEPMIGHAIPNRPCQNVGSDLFELQNEHFLTFVDLYLDFIEVDKIYDKKGRSFISKLKSQFARHGIPNQFVSDNGPPCNSIEFAEFSKEYEFEHKTSSARYPQSNG